MLLGRKNKWEGNYGRDAEKSGNFTTCTGYFQIIYSLIFYLSPSSFPPSFLSFCIFLLSSFVSFILCPYFSLLFLGKKLEQGKFH